MRQPRQTYALDRLRETRTLPPLNVSTLDFATLEQIAPSFECDADLESFLRRNNLTYALEEYIRAQHNRAA